MASSGAGLGPPGAVSDPLGTPEALQAEIAFSSITKGFSLFSGLAIHRPFPPSQGPAEALWGPPRPSVALRRPLGSTGALWGQLGPSGGRLERPGAVWARLGRSGPVWGHLGPSEGRLGPTGAAWGRPGGNCIFLIGTLETFLVPTAQRTGTFRGALRAAWACLGPSGAVWVPQGPSRIRKEKSSF